MNNWRDLNYDVKESSLKSLGVAVAASHSEGELDTTSSIPEGTMIFDYNNCPLDKSEIGELFQKLSTVYDFYIVSIQD